MSLTEFIAANCVGHPKFIEAAPILAAYGLVIANPTVEQQLDICRQIQKANFGAYTGKDGIMTNCRIKGKEVVK